MNDYKWFKELRSLPWRPGEVDADLQVQTMVESTDSKNRITLCVVKSIIRWLARYDLYANDTIAGATRLEHEFYKWASCYDWKYWEEKCKP